MTEKTASAEVTIIKSAIMKFLDTMNKNRRSMEQQIRDLSESIRSGFLASGASQFSYQDVDKLSRNYRDEFLSFYRNTIHLKVISTASSEVKTSIEEGLIDSGIVQKEWLDGFNQLQEQITKYTELSDKADNLQAQLAGSKANESDIANFQQIIQEKDQLLEERDQEIFNLKEGLMRMENQVDALGSQMLQNQMSTEDLQEAIADKDDEIDRLRSELQNKVVDTAEIDMIKEQLNHALDRERQLQSQVASASGDLVDQLQDNLEKSRDEVLKIKKEMVAKNEELYQLKLETSEFDVKLKTQKDRINQLQASNKLMEESIQEKDKKLVQLTEDATKLQELTQKLTKIETEYKEAQDKLNNYEGKVAISQEERESMEREINSLKKQLEGNIGIIDYCKGLLLSDIKYRTLFFLTTVESEIKLEEIAQGVGVPQDVVHRAVIELNVQKQVDIVKDGRYIYVKLNEVSKSPFLLEVNA
ncbi:MAG: hypothetical protein OEZ01_10575 [Candidatus Heimdallarchaeota archaeon]|nr:hypothetical protein [Candidatus Heimdallarchaeota archaeon]MDH5646445.1 hypothetical protein [Candidatus Heimdallarchaeota archaeon]